MTYRYVWVNAIIMHNAGVDTIWFEKQNILKGSNSIKNIYSLLLSTSLVSSQYCQS